MHRMIRAAILALAAAPFLAPFLALPTLAQDAGHDKDYRTFHADGRIDYGKIGDSYTADLVLYLAGNQFMVMEELIRDFQVRYGADAATYVAYLASGAAQGIYGKYGFVAASAAELKLKPLP